MYAWPNVFPSQKSRINWHSPLPPQSIFLRANWVAVSWAIVLSKTPKKTLTHNSYVVCLPLSRKSPCKRNRALRSNGKGLPWWHSGWESACQCRAHGFEPWSGKIPHAAEQLGPWATTTEPAPLEPVLRNKRGRDSERPAHRDEEWPPLATTRESPRTETKTQHSQK